MPFDKAREVPSKGLSHRTKSTITGRVQENLSTLEYNISRIIEWLGFEIREQYPLPLEDTLRIAERLGIKHPTDPYTKEFSIMRLDFLVIPPEGSNFGRLAITGKLSQDLQSFRTIEKFEIERTYFAENGITWKIVTEKEIPEGLAHNINWVCQSDLLGDRPELSEAELDYYERAILEDFVASPTTALAKSCICVDKKLGFKPGTALWLVQHFIATKRWTVDMMEKIDTQRPLKIICTSCGNKAGGK